MKIILSPRLGSGWYSLNKNYPDCLTNPELIDMIERGVDPKLIEQKAILFYPKGSWFAENLIVEDIDTGCCFRIVEFDGAESIDYSKYNDWIVAI